MSGEKSVSWKFNDKGLLSSLEIENADGTKALYLPNNDGKDGQASTFSIKGDKAHKKYQVHDLVWIVDHSDADKYTENGVEAGKWDLSQKLFSGKEGELIDFENTQGLLTSAEVAKLRLALEDNNVTALSIAKGGQEISAKNTGTLSKQTGISPVDLGRLFNKVGIR